MRQTFSGNAQTVIQAAVDAMEKRADENLARIMVLESVLYAALDRMKRTSMLDDGWSTLLSFIANKHRENGAKSDSRTASLLNRVAEGVEQYSKIVPGEGTFDPPNFTIIHGGKTTHPSEE